MFYYNDKWHDPDVAEWVYRMMNSTHEWEKFRYTDTINNYNMILEELEKHYEQTPVTQRYTRARIRNAIKRAERDLAKALADYEEFKRYK